MTTEDRKLLEKAAKAINREVSQDMHGAYFLISQGGKQTYREDWNPLRSDGDALRLAVRLRLAIYICEGVVVVESGMDLKDAVETLAPDECAAVRLAIVKCAALIGEKL